MTVIDFLQTPLAQRTTWWCDEETHDVMTSCEVCGATARHTSEQAAVDFRFEHSATCVVGLEAGRALRDEYAPGHAGDTPSVQTPTAAHPDHVLFIKRQLWDMLMDSHRDLLDAQSDYATAAKTLADALRSGSGPSVTELDALTVHLADVIDAREPERAALAQLADLPQPAPMPEDLPLQAQRGSSPVIASKRMWDNIAGLTNGTFETACALLDRLTDLVADVKAGGRPDPAALIELADALEETREALAEDRAMFQRWMGALEWVPTEA
jgi:hypothetical protein